eukprot:504412_1
MYMTTQQTATSAACTETTDVCDTKHFMEQLAENSERLDDTSFKSYCHELGNQQTNLSKPFYGCLTNDNAQSILQGFIKNHFSSHLGLELLSINNHIPSTEQMIVDTYTQYVLQEKAEFDQMMKMMMTMM